MSSSIASKAAESPSNYLDSRRPISERINDLLPRMTLQEKISQITDNWGSAEIPRLKIPSLLKTEGLHGQSYSNGATIFPHAIAMAATWNMPLIYDIGKATAVESKAAGIRQSWSPVLDVARDARWGRVEETYGEDPLLVSRAGVAWITGFQSQDMIATPKHFAGHGEPIGGRDSNDVGLSERVMREVHLEPFRRAFLDAKAGGVMAAYGTWNGVPANASKSLLRDILQQEWGFNGLIVTDCGAIEQMVTKHSISTTFEQAAKEALEAGVCIECGSVWEDSIPKAIQNGSMSEALVDQAVRRVLEAKMKLGLFKNPGPARLNWDKLPAYDTPEHRALARRTAVESMVLLKNENKLLPLSKNLKTIAVIGPNAEQVQTGDYSGKAVPGQLISVLDGIKSHVGAGTQVLYAPGFSWDKPNDKAGFEAALDIARRADVVVMVMGDSAPNPAAGERVPSTSGENIDGATLAMPGVQGDLIKAVQAVGKPVVLNVVNGKPFVLTWEAENIPAILVSWYAGEEGGNATADLLFGDRSPSGRLPITFPRSASQLPLTYDFKTSGRSYDYYDMPFAPLYRFGYGLSYSTFKYLNLQIKPDAREPGVVTITADVQNTGAVASDEVAQLYITDAVASVATPVMQLKGFQRLSLAPGETKTATFQLTPYDLSLLNERMARVVEPGVFRVHVGGASPDIVRRSANDQRAAGENQKKNVGFKDAAQGISGEWTLPQAYAARFVYSVQTPPKFKAGEEVPVTVTVKNQGNLTDVTQADLYQNTRLASQRFELKPGETKSHTFKMRFYTSGTSQISVLGGDQVVSRMVAISKSPAKLSLGLPRTQVDADGQITITTIANNIGGDAYAGNLALNVEGKPVSTQNIKLAAGESREISLPFAAERSGNLRWQLGDLPPQNIEIPGGIGMAWGTGAALSLPLNEGSGGTAKNTISGKALAISGKPQWDAQSLKISGGSFVPVGSIDLANRSFTLATWLKVEQFDGNGALGLFGGTAPMGAGQDDSGSKLHAGTKDGKLHFGFFGRDVSGQKALPLQKWVHVTFVHDASSGQGTLYIDGQRDVQKAQKPYAGALETIGTTPQMRNGQFALRDVTVINGALNATAVKLLAEKGLDALKVGTHQTEWRATTTSPTSLLAWADVPAGSRATAIVEIGDAAGKALDAKTLTLKSGQNLLPLTGLKTGAQVRIRTEMEAGPNGASPRVGSYVLRGNNLDLRWISASQWAKGNANGGAKIEEGQR